MSALATPPVPAAPAVPAAPVGGRRPGRRALLVAGVLVVVASLSIQGSAVVAHGLFDELTPTGVSGLRFLLAAAVALLLVRPRLRGRTRGEWAWITGYGAAIAAMNLAMYGALEHLPLGVAVTIELLGPLALAATRLPRRHHVLLPLVCVLGLLLIARPGGQLPVAGLALAGLAAVALACYALVAERIAAADGGGWDELALALLVAATLTSPFSARALPAVEASHLPALVVTALLGVLLAFTFDFLAVRTSSARVVAVLLSFDPVLGAVLGAVLLSQALDGPTLAGMALVVVGGVLTTLAHSSHPNTDPA